MNFSRFLNTSLAVPFVLSLTLTLAACGGGGGGGGPGTDNNNDSDTPVAGTPALTGYAQKGPFQAGGTVTLESINSDGTKTGQSVTASLDKLGKYAVPAEEMTWEGPTLITARGPYFNENKGIYENTAMKSGLQALVNISKEPSANINLFTHLTAARTLVLMQDESKSFNTARFQARDELTQLLKSHSDTDSWALPVSDDVNPTKLNLLDREKVQFPDYLAAEQDSISLLLFSSALLTALDGQGMVISSFNAGGGSTSGLDTATEDFADDGAINGDGQNLLNGMKTAVDNAADAISKATDKMKSKFNKLELFPEAPDINPQDATDALKQVLTDRYLQPDTGSGRTLDDYIDTHVSNGNVRVSVGLDSEGRVVPNEDWHAANGDYCRARVRYAAQAEETLVFKTYRISETLNGETRDQYFIYAQVLDSTNSKIQAQQESGISAMHKAGFVVPKGTTPTKDTLAQGMEAALNGLTYRHTNQSAEPKASANSPCGDIRLVHVSGSKVDEEITFMTGFNGDEPQGLSYSYYFGDGTSENGADRTTSHIYGEKGTYSVRVEVFGTVDGEDVSGNQTIQVRIGEASQYTLSFDSYFNYELDFPEGGYIHSHSRYAVEVPLTRGGDGTYRGATLMELKQKADINTPEGAIPVPDGPRPNIWVWAVIPADGALEALDVRLCFDPEQLQSAGAFAPGTLWGGMFLVAHESKLAAVPPESNCPSMSWKFQFNDWDTASSNDVLAEKTWDRIVDAMGEQPTQEKTYIKIMKQD